MKKILLFVVGAVSLVSTYSLKAQTFTIPSDSTVPVDTIIVPPFYTSVTVTSDITNITSNNETIKWHVVNTNVPNDWLTNGGFQICDDGTCRTNSANGLWNLTTHNGPSYSPIYGGNIAHDSSGLFDVSFNLLENATSTGGPFYMNISFVDQAPGGTSKILTIIFNNKIPASVSNVTNTASDVVLYPNPAHDELNVVYDATADVKNIAVYNIIGKVMQVYRVNGTSANLDLQNIPSGIYFVRLLNSQGNAVVTRKFTKQ